MNNERRAVWEERHRDMSPGAAEPSIVEFLSQLSGGRRALDVAAGNGRNSIALAAAGIHVTAVDFSAAAMASLRQVAKRANLAIAPVIADLESSFPFRPESFDIALNISFLERGLIPSLKLALRVGGLLIFDTFLIDQAASGHPRNPRFLLGHYELFDLLSDMELLRYREGIVAYDDGTRAWRAAALARRIT